MTVTLEDTRSTPVRNVGAGRCASAGPVTHHQRQQEGRDQAAFHGLTEATDTHGVRAKEDGQPSKHGRHASTDEVHEHHERRDLPK